MAEKETKIIKLGFKIMCLDWSVMEKEGYTFAVVGSPASFRELDS